MFVVKVSANRKQRDWQTRFTALPPESPYFAFQKERQGVSNVDTPEVSGRMCVFACVCTCTCVCKRKMWFELRPANRCLPAAQCFDSRVGLCTQWSPL